MLVLCQAGHGWLYDPAHAGLQLAAIEHVLLGMHTKPFDSIASSCMPHLEMTARCPLAQSGWDQHGHIHHYPAAAAAAAGDGGGAAPGGAGCGLERSSSHRQLLLLLLPSPARTPAA